MPFVTSVAQNDIQPWLTAAVFGTVSIFGGLLTLLLPETNRRPLPQTVDDIESWYRNSPNSFGDKAAQSLSSGKAEDTSRSVPSEQHSLKTEMGEWKMEDDENLEKKRFGDRDAPAIHVYTSQAQVISKENHETYF